MSDPADSIPRRVEHRVGAGSDRHPSAGWGSGGPRDGRVGRQGPDEARRATVSAVLRGRRDGCPNDTHRAEPHLGDGSAGFSHLDGAQRRDGGGKFLVHELSVNPQAVASAIGEVDRFDELAEWCWVFCPYPLYILR
jgi:hypothetical protein